MTKRHTLIALLFASCATTPAPPTLPPTWTAVPGVVLDAFCAKLQREGISPETTVVVGTTQPLVSGASLRSVAHLYGKDAEVGQFAQALNAAITPLPLALKDAAGCKWKTIAKLDPIRNVDQMVVEMSAPIPNPFQRNEAGVLARMSLGGHDAQWYWVPLGQRNGVWAIGIVLPMDMRE
jgi:hypothetical protein